MSKLPKENQFIDLSDYGRPVAKLIANSLRHTDVTPIHITYLFIVSGSIAIYFLLNLNMILAAFFLIIKSILDAADGELARIKNTPSYSGRYFDSIADILLNLIIFLSIAHITDTNILYSLTAFICVQLQGTLYNYYYVILRNRFDGDTTSRVWEKRAPRAMEGETQRQVDTLFFLYNVLYKYFDKAIYYLDTNARKDSWFPNWFMTTVSLFGLGSQLLIIGFMLVVRWEAYIIPFFILYTLIAFCLIIIRRLIGNISA